VRKEYLKRIADKELDILLQSSGAVLIRGSKWCGKTRTAEERAASAVYMQDPKERKNYSEILNADPSILLEGKTPRLIDEWQDAPVLWDSVRFAVDRRGGPGHFILTGSVASKDNAVMHSGTGRIARMLMRPMTLFESLESDGSVPLGSLFNGDDIRGVSSLTLNDLAFALVRGGWPESVGERPPLAFQHAKNYTEAVIETDVSSVDGVGRNPANVRMLMRSLARNISSEAKLTTLQGDMSADGRISEKTIASYMNALKRIFVIEDLPAWSPNMRSKAALRTSPKRHFVDPSIAAAMLRVSPDGLMKDFNTFGLLFESLCIRDLRVYAQANDGEVFHYRDKDGLEIDAVVSLHDGRWGAAEIKLGAGATDEAARNLIKLRDKVNLEEMGEPSFLAVVTASTYAYRRKDGVYVVPIGCLKD
jgi:predicted AAA+ superfamily ATPase